MTMKQVRFVKADSRNPVQEIAELAVFDASGNPVDPPTSLADGSVTTAKLANDAVTSAKIKDGSITGADIANNSITGDDLANNTVTAAKIASGVLPTNATKEKAGLVKQAAHVADPAGDTPTKAEFIVLRDALVTAGMMASA